MRALAQRVADALPAEVAEEVVLTGSVSRGLADEVSDIEMLVVTGEPLELEDCFGLARAAGLGELDTWGAWDEQARRVSGYLERVPLELVWWPREYAEARIDALLAGEAPSTADALVHGVPLRTTGLLAAWQERLREYPQELAAAQIEEALTEPDPQRALRIMTELQLETVLLAPSGPNIDRAQLWLREAAQVLR